jgi:hypothetical protein
MAAIPHEPAPAATDLSRSLAYLDVVGLVGAGALVAGVAALARRSKSPVRIALAALGAAATPIGLALRFGRRSGVSTEELHRALPGDGLVGDPQFVTDRALTIHAPVAAVWPWIVQMGYHRGGWYTNAALDRLIWHIDNPSEDRIVPEYQRLAVGDIVPDGPAGTAWWKVAALEPDRAVVYLDDAGSHIPGVSGSWAFVVDPLDAHTTRLHVRYRSTFCPTPRMVLLSRLLIGPADFVMIGQTLRGIKRRAERAVGAAGTGASWAARRSCRRVAATRSFTARSPSPTPAATCPPETGGTRATAPGRAVPGRRGYVGR